MPSYYRFFPPKKKANKIQIAANILKILGATIFTLVLIFLVLGAIYGFVSMVSIAWHSGG